MIWRVPTMQTARKLANEARKAGRPVPTFEVASVPPKGTNQSGGGPGGRVHPEGEAGPGGDRCRQHGAGSETAIAS